MSLRATLNLRENLKDEIAGIPPTGNYTFATEEELRFVEKVNSLLKQEKENPPPSYVIILGQVLIPSDLSGLPELYREIGKVVRS